MNAGLFDKLTVDAILAAYSARNYVIFEKDDKDHNFNMFGCRSSKYDTNTFNDIVGLLWKYRGKWNLRKYAATTDPGMYYMSNPISHAGTHIMKDGQYRGAYGGGLHKKSYPALRQVGPIDFYEDNNRDLHFDKSVIKRGLEINANIHGTFNEKFKSFDAAPESYFPNVESSVVGKWSAACHVIANKYYYREFMLLAYAGLAAFGGALTYTLFEEQEI